MISIVVDANNIITYIFIHNCPLLRCERAERQINNLSMSKKSEPPDHQDENIYMPQMYYHRYLLKCAEAVEPVPMQKSWIENILKVTITYLFISYKL